MSPFFNPGIILGSKIFVDFTKYEFDVAMARLKNEIARHGPTKPPSDPAVAPVTTTTSKPPETVAKPPEPEKTKNPVLSWTDKQVKKWLTDNKFHAVIIENVYPCTGEILHQYYLMKTETPEFFYQCLTGGKQLTLKYLAAFIVELTRLFAPQ